ncbi:Planctomycete cytochrome C [Rosistilla oblonga]|nr:Planctomycete cytochrome C [Rosistilla oblonga]
MTSRLNSQHPLPPPPQTTLLTANLAVCRWTILKTLVLTTACLAVGNLAWADDPVDAAAKPSDAPVDAAKQMAFFETKIRPLLAERCYDCHDENTAESELRVDTYEGMITGGLAGPALIPGKPQGSLIVAAVGYRDSTLQMPPDEKLSDAEIADLTRWVEMGAPHPGRDGMQTIKPRGDVDLEKGRQHWAFRPVAKVDPPTVNQTSPAIAAEERRDEPVRHPIDAFLLSRLEAEGLQRVPAADKRTLIRRATFDLTGLPPTPADIENFLADDSEEAFANVIDRLLSSPHYGERWGRHWLDVARYADSNGLDENVVHGHAWRYRDYVVNAFNKDKPYNEFVVEQLAGDLLPPRDEIAREHERLIATGYLVLGPKVLAEQDEAKMEMDIIDEQLDTIGRSMLGLTLGCARCHTHKFDPISHHDYYGLAGIFKSTKSMDSYKTVAKWHENLIETPEEEQRYNEHLAEVAAQEKKIAEVIAEATKLLEKPDSELALAEREKKFPAETTAVLKAERETLKKLKDSAPERPMAMGVIDGEVADTSVHLRGSHLTLGDVVPRRFPEVLASTDQPPLPPETSGRLQFAQWLTDGQHPLTARVMANRIWHGHFGKGLVTTVDNFGLQGAPPTHPELLDWLANQFVESGWSIKTMHRTIMLSEAYQRSSQHDPKNVEADPGNSLYWRFNLRRLEAEAIRDSLLAVSGQLDRTVGGNISQYKNREYVFNHTSQDKSTYDSYRRSIYVPVIRNHLYDMFQLFDYSDASVLNGNRNVSTIAPQALFLMNSEWVSELALSIADRLLQDSSDPAARIDQLYMQSFGRPATADERDRSLDFVSQFASLSKTSTDREEAERQAWQRLCQAIVASSEFVYIR